MQSDEHQRVKKVKGCFFCVAFESGASLLGLMMRQLTVIGTSFDPRSAGEKRAKKTQAAA